MPKQVLKLSKFHGGLNEGADPRDIRDEEFETIINFNVNTLGKIKLLGGVNGAEHESTQEIDGVDVHEFSSAVGTLTTGYGLFSFSSDYKMLSNDTTDENAVLNGEMLDGTSSTLVPAKYLMLGHDNGANALVHIFQKLSDTDLCWTKNNSAEINLGGTGAGAKLIFYYVNGGIRIADSDSSNNNSVKWHGIITPKVYGYPQLPEDDSETTYNYYDGAYAMRREASVYRTSEYGAAVSATGTVTFSGQAVHGDTIVLKSTEQVIRTYECDTTTNQAIGTINSNGNIVFHLSANLVNQASYLIDAINHVNGHFGQIIATSGGGGVVDLTQATAGSHGNNTITETNSSGTIAVLGFTGGRVSADALYEDSVGATNARWVTVDNEIKPCFEEVLNGDGDMCCLNAIMKTDAESFGYWYSFPKYTNTTMHYLADPLTAGYDRIVDNACRFKTATHDWIVGHSIRVYGFTGDQVDNNANGLVITDVGSDGSYIEFATTGSGINGGPGVGTQSQAVTIRGVRDKTAHTGGAAFANEYSAIGKNHDKFTSDEPEAHFSYTGNKISPQAVRSNMKWGMKLGYREGATNSGTWMPNSGVRYKFLVTTMYDDGTQESLPQLLAQYTSWDVAPDVTSTEIEYKKSIVTTTGVFTDTTCNYDDDQTVTCDANTAILVGMYVAGSTDDASDIPADNYITAITESGGGGTGVTSFELNEATINGQHEDMTLIFSVRTNRDQLVFHGVDNYAGWREKHGFNVGQRINITGFNTAANNGSNILIYAVTETTLAISLNASAVDEDPGANVNVVLNQAFEMDQLDWQDPPDSIDDPEFFINFSTKTAKSEVRLSNYQTLRGNGTNNRMWFSPTFKINGAQAGDIDGDAQPDFSNKFVFGNGDASSTAYGNPRISGVKIYWSSNEDGYSTLWEMMHCDFNKGVKALGIDGSGGESGWAPWKQHSVFPASDGSALAEEDSQNPGHYLSVDFGGSGDNRWLNPPRFRTYFENNFHEHNDVVKVDSYKTAVVANNRTYIGNVQQTINGTIETFPDRILKSPRDQYDKFPSESFFDIGTQGDDIIHLTAYADRLLQFGNLGMHIINISGDTDYVEDTHKFKGISSPAAVITTDAGVAWVNKRGVYFYDGKQVANLLEKGGAQVIDDATWNAFCIDPAIGFIPRKKELIVVDSVSNTGEGIIYHYSFITKAWIQGGSVAWEQLDDASKTNMIVDYDGELIYFDYSGDKMEVWRDTPDADSGKAANLITKDFDFGDPSVRKKVYKVYLSYKGDGTNVEVTYGENGRSPSKTFNIIDEDGVPTASATQKCLNFGGGGTQPGTNDWFLAELRPSSTVNDIYSFNLRIGSDYTNAIAADFEINDISIVYRKKPVK